ncbi:hypothetical protein CTKZ_17890 [Cellulomonas algicola]|uniref:Uncharacterized protein n=1 Tax=Cellulomonas algicola TaxID=2071633 RepID=A0A401UZV3_9CELL|nr:hypothetical protein [Cellulomonas algicola]GCD20227.1 hypothetical protein CTKZ_17890 [Cellulomonas algicola]
MPRTPTGAPAGGAPPQALLSLQALAGNHAVTGLVEAGAPTLQRQQVPAAPPTAPPAAPPAAGAGTPFAAPAEPQHRFARIATWTGWTDSAVTTHDVVGAVPIAHHVTPIDAVPASITPVGWTPGQYESLAAATAAIKSAGTAGAVFLENGRYVAYHASGETLLSAFTLANVLWFPEKPWTAVRFDTDAQVIVTEDGAELRPTQFTTKDDAKTRMADQALMPGAGTASTDPFAGYKQGLDLTKPAVLELAFGAAMRDNALAVLASARVRVQRDVDRRFASGTVSQAEIQTMRSTAEYLAGIDAEIAAIPKTLPSGTQESYAEFQANHARFQALQARRRVVLARYPALARVDATAFARLSPEEQNAQLGADALQVLEDIDTTRNNIHDGSVNLWKIRSVVDSTIAGLGISDPEARKQVENLVAANQTSIAETVLTLFTLAFGIGAAFATGPVGVALAAGAFGLGVADAISQTEAFFAEHAASNTDLDPAQSLLSPEEARSWGWLVVAWVGVVADAAQVVTALKAVKAANGTLEVGVTALAKGDQRLATDLRRAAGIADAGEVLTEALRPGLSRRVGTTIEVNASLAPREIRVDILVDDAGRVSVQGMVVGAEATVGEILAHGQVVTMVRRYDGLVGKIRELVDKVRSLAGFPAPGVNPFKAGSQAYESFFEVMKLPDIIAARRAALGRALGTAEEDVLRREVRFLESELVEHSAAVERMAAEKGSGFVAAAGEETRNAIRSGAVPPLEGNALVKDPSAYYYRRNPAGDPPFLLTRFADSKEPALTLVREGSGWKIATGALSRREEGAALVASWSDDLKRGFAALVGRFADATVVPLRGVATTRRRLQEVVTGAQQYELRQILAEALRTHPDPLVEATQSVDALLAHEIVVVRGTDQLRAYNYRLAFETASGAPASGDLHHLIPLYLGGDHRRLVDIEPLLHDRLHTLIEGIPIGDGVTLAPSSIQNSAALTFDYGAGILSSNGRVQLGRFAADGTFVPVP